MECFVTFVAIMMLLTALIVSFSGGFSGHLNGNQAIQRTAARFHGTFASGGWFGRPSFRFLYGSAKVLVNLLPRGGPQNGPMTQVQIDWPDPAFRCEITRLIAHPQYGNLPQVSTRLTREDSLWCVHGADGAEVQRLISDGFRWQLRQLLALASDGRVRVLISHGRMLVQLSGAVRREEPLQAFVVAALGLYDQACLSRAEGIEFLDDGQLQVLQDAKCQVCGEEIISDLVFCRRCKTPHHHECWQYNGKCTIYACGETVCLHPQLAQHVHQPHAGEPATSAGMRPQ